MRQILPDICNFCGKDISSEIQYSSEWFQGRSSFGQNRIRLKERIDCCHTSFMEVCKNGLKPTWIKEAKNPQYRPGSKLASEKYYIPTVEPEVQQKIPTEATA